MLHAILQDPSSRALYLFPTKALAQDQLAELQAMCETLRPDDGPASRSACSPTTATRRRTRGARSARARTSCSAIPTWCTRASCRTIRAGRSCSRTCATWSSTSCTPIAASSAAICATCCGGCGASAGTTGRIRCSSARRRRSPNPRELAERLTEQPFELVDRSGAPRGEKFFVFVNPPVVNHQLGIRRSYLGETRRIASEFLKRKLQLIVFAQSRLSTEILTTYLKDDFEGVPGAPERIRGYRGGYLPTGGARSRRGCARARCAPSCRPTRSSSASTSARSTCAVMAGYPGTIAATWQRAGRAGRRASRSAAVMVASSAPLDQFVVRNPSYFFDASPERALIDPDNLHILVDHIKCAAFELPFTAGGAFGRHDVQEILGILAEQGLVHRTASPTISTRRTMAVDLDQRVVSGRRGQPAVGVVGQLRDRRHDAASRG